MNSERHKRMKTCHPAIHFDAAQNCLLISNDPNDSDVDSDDDDAFSLGDTLEELAEDKYGTVTKECDKLLAQLMQFENVLLRMKLSMSSFVTDTGELLSTNSRISPHFNDRVVEANDKAIIVITPPEDKMNCDGYPLQTTGSGANDPMIVFDSDEEAQEFLNTDVDNVSSKLIVSCSVDNGCYSVVPLQIASTKTMQKILQSESPGVDGGRNTCRSLVVKITEEEKSNTEIHPSPDPKSLNGSALLSSDDESDRSGLSSSEEEFNGGDHQDDDACGVQEDHSLDELWKEMSFALEYSKENVSKETTALVTVEDHKEDCEHDYLLKDDVGLVCQICGLIKKCITTIFDYQWRKGPQTTKTFTHWPHKLKDTDKEIQLPCAVNFPEDDFSEAKLSIHPWHLKQMKRHQIEGFYFLQKNLLGHNPGGCILAHAPGSGKTFMLISFIQSFLASFPSAKPLIVLPKGILPTWKREFKRWQVEDITLYDLYSTKAEGRSSQLEVLTLWEEKKSVLLMGYKQFSNIISDVKDKVCAACQERLLKVPTLLILDEGHTPRNKDTEILSTLAKVQTPRKVVLSGTLFQNRVKEVFNILNLVRQNFLRMESSRAVVKRVLGGRSMKTDVESLFFELVEETLQNDDDPAARVRVIRDLREMTKDVLHYYKGYFLEELPGLYDFTVMLKLTDKQRDLIEELESYEKFKGIAVGSSVFLHPCLKDLALRAYGNKEIDQLIDSMDVNEGVKMKFLLEVLSMADSAGERVLVFSQYILPLRFLERVVSQMKGWRSGKEIFLISGDTSTEQREWAMERFNSSSDAKVLFGSIKACGEGISLVGASRVVILDVHLNPSVSKQAIARAFRPGQTKRVVSYRLVAADSPEERNHVVCVRKEIIARMWFEWDERCRQGEFELERVRVEDCEDLFLRHLPSVRDIKALYQR